MNKEQFLREFKEKSNFLSNEQREKALKYFENKLPDDGDFEDVESCIENIKSSLEASKNQNENQPIQTEIIDDNIKSQPFVQENSFAQEEKPASENKDSFINVNMQDGEVKEPILIKTPGIYDKFKNKTKFSDPVCKIFFVIFTIILLPFIVSAIVLMGAAYAFTFTIIFISWLTIFIITALIVVLAVIGLSYGIATLIVNISTGLMEIGLGTILFSAVVAIWALNYQLMLGILPLSLRCITKFLKHLLTDMKYFIFGKEEISK